MMESNTKEQEANNNIQHSHLDHNRSEFSNFYLLSDNPGAVLYTVQAYSYYATLVASLLANVIETLKDLENIYIEL